MNALRALLSEPQIQHLMLVCSIPLVMGSELNTQAAALVDVTQDVRDQWATVENSGEHCEILHILANWVKDGGKSVMLVGGDVHFGMHSIVTDEIGAPLFEQVVTSPITNEPTTGITGLMQDVFAGKCFTLYKRFVVRHDDPIHKRNYALVWRVPDGWKYCIYT